MQFFKKFEITDFKLFNFFLNIKITYNKANRIFILN